MNNTGIEWCTHTWNPITGCLFGCVYCYAREVAHRFPAAFPNGFQPTFHENRLLDVNPNQKPRHIFVGSMTDMFGLGIHQDWTRRVFMAMESAPQHTYTILTKQPACLPFKGDPSLPYVKHLQIGTSITGRLDEEEASRLCALDAQAPTDCNTIVSLEPYLTQMNPADFERFFAHPIHWLIIGGQTGRKSFQPPLEWLTPLVDWSHERGVPVFVKNNCKLLGMPQEFPERVPR